MLCFQWLKIALFPETLPSTVAVIYYQEVQQLPATSVVGKVEISHEPQLHTHIGWMLVIVILCFKNVTKNKLHHLRSDWVLTLILMHGQLHDLSPRYPLGRL
jgi:ABC-type uncharacterized transport system permease subunit